ncbi:MAG: hypothetical protein HWE24_15075 [Oceanospirillaceae bacterium]|nr:hypothetical protein [Oceanospirillaceae bacterium]
MNRKVKQILLAVFCLLFGLKTSAAIYVVHDTVESSVRALTFKLSQLLPSGTSLAPVRLSSFMKNLSLLKQEDVLIAVGAENFRQICASVNTGVVIAIFIGKEEYLKAQSKCSVSSSGVFSGAPLDKRLALLEAIWFDRKPLAVIYSDNLLVDEQAMQKEARQYGFEFIFQKTELDRLSILKSINFVLEESSVIFSLVDTDMYKDGVAQDILKLLFRKQQVMIGPSYAFVRSGSMFAIYSDTSAKLEVLVEYITRWNEDGVMPDATYPNKLRVSFNPYLLKSNGVVPPSSSYLREKYGLCSEERCE